MRKRSSIGERFERFSQAVTRWTGSTAGVATALVVILIWASIGPAFAFSDTWQLVINTSTTIVTFLMVFLIQNTQNRDGAAIQTKLDELIRASAAQNRYIGIEHLTEQELDELRQRCETRAKAEKLDVAFDAADEAEDAANEKATCAAANAVGVRSTS